MSKYSKNLDDTMNKYRNSRDRQTDELHRKLAMRRQAREQALREKQKKEVNILHIHLIKVCCLVLNHFDARIFSLH